MKLTLWNNIKCDFNGNKPIRRSIGNGEVNERRSLNRKKTLKYKKLVFNHN